MLVSDKNSNIVFRLANSDAYDFMSKLVDEKCSSDYHRTQCEFLGFYPIRIEDDEMESFISSVEFTPGSRYLGAHCFHLPDSDLYFKEYREKFNVADKTHPWVLFLHGMPYDAMLWKRFQSRVEIDQYLIDNPYLTYELIETQFLLEQILT